MSTQEIRKIRQTVAKAYADLLEGVPEEIVRNDMIFNYFLCELIQKINNDLTRFLQEDIEELDNL